VDASSEHSDLDAIFANWCVLAAIAWQGFLTEGCGAVVVDIIGERAQISYRSAAPPRCHARVIECYDPYEQMVVVVQHQHGESVYRLNGRPSPRDCFEGMCANTMQATVH